MRPTFLYVGPDKAGSSWLHEVLRQHPEVWLTPAKGLYFFDRYYDRGLPWYLSQFDATGPQHRVVGEVCQDYLFHPEAPLRIAESLGSPRMMVTLRDPAERAFSSYLHMIRSGWEPGNFLEALDRLPELLDHGRYATHLERFTRHFGPDSVHVTVFDDLVADPQQYVDSLTRWLCIGPLPLDTELREARLPAGRARSTRLSRLVSWGARSAREHDRADLVGRVKRLPFVQHALYRRLTDDKPALTDEERTAVHQALAGEVARLDETYGLGLQRRWGWPGPA